MLLLQQISLAESECVVATDPSGGILVCCCCNRSAWQSLSVLLLQQISLAESECVVVATDQPGGI